MAAPAIPNPPVALKLLSEPPASHRIATRTVETEAGRRYRLFTAMPAANSAETLPALYMLDGNAAFDALSGDMLASHPGLAVIGIGYETDRGFDFEARARDYTPPAAMPDPRHPTRASGEAARFLAALTRTLIPGLEAALPLDPARRTLWGHSFGGLFALHALAHAPEAFAGYSVVSPSLWWDGGAILDALAQSAPTWPPRAVDLCRTDKVRRSDGSLADPENRVARLEALLAERTDLFIRALAGVSHRAALDRSLPGALAFAAREI